MGGWGQGRIVTGEGLGTGQSSDRCATKGVGYTIQYNAINLYYLFQEIVFAVYCCYCSYLMSVYIYAYGVQCADECKLFLSHCKKIS